MKRYKTLRAIAEKKKELFKLLPKLRTEKAGALSPGMVAGYNSTHKEKVLARHNARMPLEYNFNRYEQKDPLDGRAVPNFK